MFERKITNDLSPRQRIAMFQTGEVNPSHSAGKESYGEMVNRQNQPDPSHSAGKESYGEMMNRQNLPNPSHSVGKESYGEMVNTQNQLGVFSKPIKITTKELMERQYLLKRRLIENTLRKRRNAVCSEIERGWFLQGRQLEKHRHNLRATLELQDRGLMMWWLTKGELLKDEILQHRKMNFKKKIKAVKIFWFNLTLGTIWCFST